MFEDKYRIINKTNDIEYCTSGIDTVNNVYSPCLTKDKVGNYIYEGDILSIEGTRIADKIIRVVILDGFSYWVSKDGTKENADMYFTKTIAENSTVIGNIYENKNLIKQIQDAK